MRRDWIAVSTLAMLLRFALETLGTEPSGKAVWLPVTVTVAERTVVPGAHPGNDTQALDTVCRSVAVYVPAEA